MSRRIALVVLALTAAAAFFAVRHGRFAASDRPVPAAQPVAALLAKGASAAPAIRPESWSVFEPNPGSCPSIELILAEADPVPRSAFQDGMDFLRTNDFDAARAAFEQAIQPDPKAKIAAWASFAEALSYYRQGGPPNLHQAANQFIRFLDAYKSDRELDELIHAAMIDLPAVLLDLMHFAPSEYERTVGARLAVPALQALLARWPDDPQAQAARTALAEAKAYLARSSGAVTGQPHN